MNCRFCIKKRKSVRALQTIYIVIPSLLPHTVKKFIIDCKLIDFWHNQKTTVFSQNIAWELLEKLSSNNIKNNNFNLV